ncbi:TIGR02234 family membrane protein [Streptomyces sp. NPDC001407]|uniref:TIGR02234 family membrane protein n=1 Tax=unclassified Streptomyces TaxID=2593676 RepID=UPI0036B5EB80
MSAAVPHPRPHAEPAPRAGGARRRSVAAALLLGAAGATLVLLAGGRTWAEGTAAADIAQSAVSRQVSGQDVNGLPGALAVVGLATLVAVFAVRGVWRTVVAAVLTLCGAGIVAGAAAGAYDTSALEEKAAKAQGLTSTAVDHISRTPWPWVALAGGFLLFLAGLLALRYGRHWPAMSGRYERDGTPRPRRPRTAPDPERPEELWKALDRGEDPTGETGGAHTAPPGDGPGKRP